MKAKNIVISIIIIIIAGFGIYYFTKHSSDTKAPATTGTNSGVTATSTGTGSTVATTTASNQNQNAPQVVIGQSVQGRDITAYNYGTGATQLLFVGGIHGGYEWNTSLVAYQLMDYLAANPGVIPANERITVIPVLNPDGLAKVTGKDGRFTAADVNPSSSVQVAGRFNANTVDLNRNFDCDWQAKGVWQNTPVSGGASIFSEPESFALENYVLANKPAAAIVWYSSAGGVYAASCGGSISTDTSALVQTFANASGYSAHATFDSYATTGDMTNWLSKIGVPAASVLLTNHTDTEWSKNLAGFSAVIKSYAK